MKTRLKQLASFANSPKAPPTRRMPDQEPDQTTSQDIAKYVVGWVAQWKSVHWIIPRNPERPRILFRVRPQYKDLWTWRSLAEMRT